MLFSYVLLFLDLDSKHGKERNPSGGKKHKRDASKQSEAGSSKDMKSSDAMHTTSTQQGKVKDIKEIEIAETVDSLSQEVKDKLAVSDKENVIDKQEELGETKSELTESGKSSKESETKTDKISSVTPSERNKDENSSSVTPVRQESQSDLVGSIDSELDPETVANMIKSPSSQSIQRPPPDHTREQEKVLQELAESAKPHVMY